MLISVNMNYGEHERNRIKRCKIIRERLKIDGIKYTFEQGFGGYTFKIESNILPDSIKRLCREITIYK
jgi:hypothetical protein